MLTPITYYRADPLTPNRFWPDHSLRRGGLWYPGPLSYSVSLYSSALRTVLPPSRFQPLLGVVCAPASCCWVAVGMRHGDTAFPERR